MEWVFEQKLDLAYIITRDVGILIADCIFWFARLIMVKESFEVQFPRLKQINTLSFKESIWIARMWKLHPMMQTIGVVTRKPEAGSHAWFASKHGFADTFQSCCGWLVFLVGITDEFHKCVQNEQNGKSNLNRGVQRGPQHQRTNGVLSFRC